MNRLFKKMKLLHEKFNAVKNVMIFARWTRSLFWSICSSYFIAKKLRSCASKHAKLLRKWKIHAEKSQEWKRAKFVNSKCFSGGFVFICSLLSSCTVFGTTRTSECSKTVSSTSRTEHGSATSSTPKSLTSSTANSARCWTNSLFCTETSWIQALTWSCTPRYRTTRK